MPGFLERMGYIPAQRPELIEEVPAFVRNALFDRVIAYVTYVDDDSRYSTRRPVGIKAFIENLAYLRLQDPPENYRDSWFCQDILKQHLGELPWYYYYEAIELIAKEVHESDPRIFNDCSLCGYADFQTEINRILERVNSAWMLNGSAQIERRRSPEQTLLEQEVAEEIASLDPVREHLKKAKTFLNTRPCDAANSIKESISAVESRGKLIFPGTATLGDVVSRLRSSAVVPPGLIAVLEKFYAFANQEPGVRHGGVTAERVQVQEADLCYFVSLSFVKYLSFIGR